MKILIHFFVYLFCSTLFAVPTKYEFLKAALNGNQEIISDGLAEKGFEYARLRDKEENTPLHLACCTKKGGNKTAIIAQLLKYGGEVNAVNSHFSTPLHIAVSNNYIDGVKLLLKQPAIKLNEQNDANMTPLLFALGNRSKEIMKLLLHHEETDPNVGTSDGLTPLHFAAMWGYVEETEILLENLKTIPDIKQVYGDFTGATPLHYAAMQAKPKIVEILLRQKGINPSAKISTGLYEGFTALHFAVMNPNTPLVFETVKQLIAAGVKINTKSKSGHLPSDLTSVQVIQKYLKNPDPSYILQKKNR